MDTTRTVSGDGDAKLVFRSGERYGEVLRVKGSRVSIGRSATNDIVLDETGMVVSSFHAVVNRESEGSWWIEDLKSKNGTFVNRRRVKRQRLQEGDVLSLAATGPVLQFTTLSENSDLVQTSWNTWNDSRTVNDPGSPLDVGAAANVKRSARARSSGARGTPFESRPDSRRLVAAGATAGFLLVLTALVFFVLHDSGHHGHDRAPSETASSANAQPTDAGREGDVLTPHAPESEAPIEISAVIEPIYGSLFHSYRDQPLGTVTVRNTSSKTASGLKLSFAFKSEADNFMVEPFVQYLPDLPSGESTEVTVLPRLSNEVLSHETREVTTLIRVLQGRRTIIEQERSLYVHGRNVFNWEKPDRISAFIDPHDPAVDDFLQAAWRRRPRVTQTEFPPARFQDAIALITALAELGLRYLPDARTPISSKIDWKAIDRVNFPWQTLTRRAGDCDDLSVLCASVLEAAQIRSAIVVGPDHVLMMFDSGLDEDRLDSSPLDPDTVVPWKGRLWIPVETTNLGEVNSNFATAWSAGEIRRQEILEEMDIVDVRESWEHYSPMNPGTNARMRQKIDAETWVVDGLTERIADAIENVRLVFERNLARHVQEITASVEPGADLHRELGLLYARNRLFGRGRLEFEEALFGAQTIGLDGASFDSALTVLSDDRDDVPFLLMNYGVCLTLEEGSVDRLKLASRVYGLGLEKLPTDDTLPERAEFLLRLALVHRLQGDLASERNYRDLAFASNPALRETYDGLIRGAGARAGANDGIREYLLAGLR